MGKKKDKARNTNGIIRFDVIGTGGDKLSSPSLALSGPDFKVIFNVGDGTQRLCTEFKHKLPKVQALFLSDLSAANVSGLRSLVVLLSRGLFPYPIPSNLYLFQPPRIYLLSLLTFYPM